MNKIFAVLFLLGANVLFGQQTIKNLQWLNVNQEIEKLTIDDGLTLYAETENLKDGEAVKVSVWYASEESDELVGEYLTRVTKNKIMFHWYLAYEDLDKLNSYQHEIETREFAKPNYYFSIQYQKLKSQDSKLLSVRAWIRQKFVEGYNDEPLAFKKYTLLLPDDSEIVGWTDGEGNIRPEKDIEAFGDVAWYIMRSEDEEPETWPPYQLAEKPVYYRVKAKDSLWKIASYDFIYGNPYLWKHLYEANKHNFVDDKNPHLIEPGQTLIIPQLKGEAREGTR